MPDHDVFTLTEENYLKLLYLNQYELGKPSTTNFLAEQTQNRPSTVTEMLKKLAKKRNCPLQALQRNKPFR